ncbi:DUF484 family protein [Marinicella meishanensis]|uniref:DUF484 family protein n=1 Tax=Marinicella meishanensis TaxID=2873263 RepID=UPI001CBA8976|nr:DUF484 family protein [Marinicella sp. NBU2979]
MSEEQKLQQAVKKYLLKNPGFFSQHPELVNTLEITQADGSVSDFTAHQLRSLQQENQQLKTQLANLIRNAGQSESMMNRLFDLLTQLAVVREQAFLPQLVEFVEQNFSSDYFKLLLDAALVTEATDHLAVITANQRKQFSVFQAKAEPLSGRLKQEQLNGLFPGVNDIASAVVLPIGSQAQHGLMAFASRDQEKFHPNLASDLLQKLSQIVATHCAQQPPADETQVMS